MRQEVDPEKELQRIRSTYSFKLGLLLTDSFVRRPWMVFVLPFRLITLSYRFAVGRKEAKKNPKLPSLDLRSNPHCLMLIATTEEGLASIERCASIAKGWMEGDAKREAVILSTSDAVSHVAPEGCSVYTLPDPKLELSITTSNWNQICANMLVTLMDSHRPIAFIFDGPYPYSGILKAMSMRPWIDAHWIRSHPVTDVGLKKRSSSFKSILKLTTYSNGAGVVSGVANRSDSAANLSSDITRVFYAIGYDKRQGDPTWGNKLKLLIKGREGVEIVTNDDRSLDGLGSIDITSWKRMACSNDLNTIDLAIVGSEPHLIQQLLSQKVPTLSIVGSSVEQHRLLDLRKRTFQSGLMVLNTPDQLELELAVNSLFQKKTQRAMRARPSVEHTWDGLFDHIAA
jgi:hypothetical protein